MLATMTTMMLLEVALLRNATTSISNLTARDDDFFNNKSTVNIVRPNPPVDDDDDDILWFWIVVDGLLMLAIIFGNTLTILAVTLSRRLSNLISNHFVLNLALSDLTVGLTLPYHLAFYLNTGLGRIKETCVLRFMLIMLACSASILNLIAIAVDRYVAILHPLHYNRYMTKTVTRSVMVVAWALAVSASMVPIFWNNWGENNTCEVQRVIPKEYTMNVLAPLFSLVWIVMFVLYWRIWREASMHARRMRSSTCSASGPNDWKSVQVVFMVLGSFSLCWMPYVVVVCTQTATANKEHSHILYKAVFSLAMANSGINPVIYAWKNTGFRRAFLRLLRCRSPEYQEFERSFRNNNTNASASEQARKVPLEQMAKAASRDNGVDNGHGAQEPSAVAVGESTVIANNNCVRKKSDRCRIIENMAYDEDGTLFEGADRCHIIENLAFEGSLDANNIRMIDSYGKESTECCDAVTREGGFSFSAPKRFDV